MSAKSTQEKKKQRFRTNTNQRNKTMLQSSQAASRRKTRAPAEQTQWRRMFQLISCHQQLIKQQEINN